MIKQAYRPIYIDSGIVVCLEYISAIFQILS